MTEPPEPLCLQLDLIRDDDVAFVGPKAHSLARLRGCGLPVPNGFCLVASCFRQHLAAGPQLSTLMAALATADTGQQPAILAAIRRAVVDQPLAADVRAALAAAWSTLAQQAGPTALHVAVRSSGTAEDLPGQSFAGQHDTLLNVVDADGCGRAIRQCWASLWTDRAYQYRMRNGIDHDRAAMAVIVQQLVEADASAVVFTADPVSGRTDRVIVESTLGLGEALVSGRVTPDRSVLERPALTVIERTIGGKAIEVAIDDSGGTSERAVDAARAAQPSLSGAQTIELARLALVAEQAFGVPLDLEAAVVDEKIYLLQARPITTLKKSNQVWTNLNTGEVVPDVVTPATWSVVKPLVLKLLGSVFAQLGISFGDNPVIGLVAGRVYFNLNTVLGMARHIPGLRQDNLAALFGGSQQAVTALGAIQIRDEDVPPTRINWFSVLAHLPRLLVDFLWRAPAQGSRLIEKARADNDRLAALDLEHLDDDELMAVARTTLGEMLGRERAMVMAGVGVSYQSLLFDRCRRWFGAEQGGALASRLLSGLGHNDNAAAGVALWQLAQLVHARPAIAELVRTSTTFALLRTALTVSTDGAAFLDGWQRFMVAHGHHCRGELELYNARWDENPSEILGQLRSYLDAIGPRDFLAQYQRVIAERRTAEDECRRRLRNPFKRWLLGFVLDRAQRCAGLRESFKNQIVRTLAVLRRLLLAIGQRLVARGTLAAVDDIFFLDLEEIATAMAASAPAGKRDLVTRRRAEYQRNLALQPPAVVVGNYDPAVTAVTAAVAVAGELRGFGVNPGLVRGRARVILRAGEDQVLAGEILVAPFTDPGWTPYFLNAAAIVMDQGGLLSHGSIVAREFGIPAVVNVGSATTTIKTGQLIEVDGSAGSVRIVE